MPFRLAGADPSLGGSARARRKGNRRGWSAAPKSHEVGRGHADVDGLEVLLDAVDLRGISRDGAVIIVRPDMYVAHIAGLEDTDSIARFFEPIFDLSQSADAQPRTKELDHVG